MNANNDSRNFSDAVREILDNKEVYVVVGHGLAARRRVTEKRGLRELRKSLNILLVDSETSQVARFLQHLRQSGREFGYQRVESRSGLEAALSTNEWGIVLIPSEQPQIVDSDTIRSIKAHHPQARIMVTFENLQERQAGAMVRAGASDVLSTTSLAELLTAFVGELSEAAKPVASRDKESVRARISREQLAWVVENAAEGISIAQDGVFVYVNAAVTQLTGYSREELEGRPILSIVHPDDRDRIGAIHSSRLERKKAPNRYEYRIIDADGDTRWIQNNVKLIPWGNELLGMAFMRDVTARREAEGLLRTTGEELRLERADRKKKEIALSELLAHVQSDREDAEQLIIRNIRRAVLPSVQRLKENCLPHQKEDIEIIESELTDLLSPFLDTLQEQSKLLSTRELEVCRLIKRGMTSKEIADTLNIAPATVHKYRELIRKKLKIKHKNVNLSTYLQRLE